MKGFTLVELLIVVVIVGVLVAVALPKYQRSVERGRALVGLAALRQYADRMNAWYIKNDRYPQGLTDLNKIKYDWVGVGTNELFSGANYIMGTSGYSVRITRNPSSGWDYVLTATLVNGEIGTITCSGADCEALGLNNL